MYRHRLKNKDGQDYDETGIPKQQQKLLPQQVAEQIMNLIMDRELKSGDKLPNEFEMVSAAFRRKGNYP